MNTSLNHRNTGKARRAGRARMRAVLAGAGLAAALTGVPAAAQAATAAPPPAAPGLTPGVASVGSTTYLFYTGPDRSVWMKNLSTGRISMVGGRLIGGPAAVAADGGLLVTGRGTDDHTWTTSCTSSGSCGTWHSLGGNVTSPPAVSFIGTNDAGVAEYAVYARGADGAIWESDRDGSRWTGFFRIGGALLPGTSPAVAHLGSDMYLLAVGTNRELYIEREGITEFASAGGRTTVTPALVAIAAGGGAPAELAGFARGTDNAGYYTRFVVNSGGFPAVGAGWYGMGGQLTSGLGATTQVISSVPYTVTAGLGSNGGVFAQDGNWSTYPPAFTGWHGIR